MSCVISERAQEREEDARGGMGRLSHQPRQHEVSLRRPKIFQGTKDVPGAERLGGCLGKRSLRWGSRYSPS